MSAFLKNSSLYISFVVIANLTASILFEFGFLTISLGTIVFSFLFTIKDKLQELSLRGLYALILVATIISFFINLILQAPLQIVLASVIAFFSSSLLDSWVFSKIQKSFFYKSIISNLIATILDSLIFNIIAFSNSDLQPLILSLTISDVLIKIIFSSLVIPVYYQQKRLSV